MSEPVSDVEISLMASLLDDLSHDIAVSGSQRAPLLAEDDFRAMIAYLDYHPWALLIAYHRNCPGDVLTELVNKVFEFPLSNAMKGTLLAVIADHRNFDESDKDTLQSALVMLAALDG